MLFCKGGMFNDAHSSALGVKKKKSEIIKIPGYQTEFL